MPKWSLNQTLDEQLHRLTAQGNHEAYERLVKRYRFHTFSLCRDVLAQYPNTGVSIKELTTVCAGYFQTIVSKFDASLNSFFSFWKEMVMHHVMQYLINNSYVTEFDGVRGVVSLDDDFEDRHPVSDMICEKDDDRMKKRFIFEIKNIIMWNRDSFTDQESMVLGFVLNGYTLGELEHTGVMSLSSLYLTFNSATKKLQKLVKRIKINNK